MHPDDLPPALEWELALYQLYVSLRTQWQYSMDGYRLAFNYATAYSMAHHREWDLDLVTELLNVIETAVLKQDADERAANKDRAGHGSK